MILAMPQLTKQDIKTIEGIFDRKFDEKFNENFDKKFDEKFDQKFDEKFNEKIAPFTKAVQLEFQKIEKRFLRIEDNFQWIKDNIYKKLNDFISTYKKHDEEIIMLTSQSRRLTNRVDSLDERVTKLES